MAGALILLIIKSSDILKMIVLKEWKQLFKILHFLVFRMVKQMLDKVFVKGLHRGEFVPLWNSSGARQQLSSA